MATGTGTRATTPYAVAAGELVAAARVALDDGDAAAFSDAELLAFVGEAVREYSQHLPRKSVARLAAAGGARRVALPHDTTAVLSVEYPADAEPPSYIGRRPYKSRLFTTGRNYDGLTAAEGPVLLLGFAPDDGATLAVRYTHPHAVPTTADDYLTVPADHHHVLVQYALFAAARQLQAREQSAPTNNSNLLMSQLASNTRRLELAYLNALNRILYHRLGEGEFVAWAGG